MKDNLKTFPKFLTGYNKFGQATTTKSAIYHKWRKDFEAELRKRLDDATIIGMSDRPVSIREILGEEK